MNTKKILNEINNRAKDKKKLVVGIDGYSGIGKTTLLDNLVKSNKDILPVYRDDFIKSSKVIEEFLKNTDDKSNNYVRPLRTFVFVKEVGPLTYIYVGPLVFYSKETANNSFSVAR